MNRYPRFRLAALALLLAVQTSALADPPATPSDLILRPGVDTGYVRLANASARGLAGTGENALMLGFSFGGDETKSLLVRAAGPALRSLGVATALVDPRLQVIGRGVSLANDNWENRPELAELATQVGAFQFASSSKDAALVAKLTAGNYTAVVSSADGSTGVAVAEAYDANALASAPCRLANLSVRGQVGTGDGLLTAGFVVTGTSPLRVLVRGIGPTLASVGVGNPAVDPQIAVYSGATLIAQNDNWDGSASMAAEFAKVGAFALPAGSKDAALVATLAPGAYTVVLSGIGTSAGVALIEVYDATVHPDYAETRRQVQEYVRKTMASAGVVGAAVALVDSDSVILQEGFGVRDATMTIPATANTPFSIGSVTKTMAAMMVMQLVSDGKLDLDAPLNAALPTFSIQQRFRSSAPITLRSILAHHSGITGDVLVGSMTTVANNRWCDFVLSQLANEYTERPVGEFWGYNNSGYVILQNVIERASGLTFDEYTKRRLFEPAGMATATFGPDAPDASIPFAEGTPLPYEYVNAGTAGTVKASAADMARYLRMLLHEGLGDAGRVLAPSVFRQMLVRQYPNDPFDSYGGNTWGLGFQLDLPSVAYAGSSFGHAGATRIFNSQMIVLRTEGIGVFAVSNTAAPDSFSDQLAQGVLRIALQNLRGVTPDPLATSTPSPVVTKSRTELEALAGVYAPGFGAYDRVIVSGNGLEWTQAAGIGGTTKFLLLPRADGTYLAADGGPVVEFKTIAGHAVMSVSYRRATYVDHYVSGEKITPMPISAAWQQRVGEYVWTNLPLNNYDDIVLGPEVAKRVALSIRDGFLVWGGDGAGYDVILPATDTLGFTCGIGFELGRGRGDALRVEANGGIDTLWFRGQSARLATLPVSSYMPPEPADFSTLGWTAAFEAAHQKFAREYAFTDWKQVDWTNLYRTHLPMIQQAEAAHDEKAYFRALLGYVNAIPDGHVRLTWSDATIPNTVGRELAGGGFGLGVAELDDGRIIAAAVVPNGPAAASGIAVGAEIVSWDGKAVKEALAAIDPNQVPLRAATGNTLTITPLATAEHYRLEQVRLLVRAPIGATRRVGFRNPGVTTAVTVSLTAIDDAGAGFALVDFARRAEFTDRIDYRILPDGFGYVQVRLEADLANLTGYPTQSYQQFQKAITALVAARVPGIILDLRGNFGGSDQLAADLSGFFHQKAAFYESQSYYDARNGQFLPFSIVEHGSTPIAERMTIDPQTPYFGGKVVALVNPGTISSGEGPAMAIARLPQGHVIGFHGTNGSFGMVGDTVLMPGGYLIEFPFGRSLNEQGVVQLDSRDGVGGVEPNPRVPKTYENALAFGAGTDVELNYAIAFLKTQ